MTRDEHIRAEGAINALDVTEPRIRELEAKVAALEAENGRLREATDRWEEFASYLIRAEKNRAAYQGEDVLELAAKHAAQVLNDCRAQQPSPAQDKEQG